MLRTNLHKNDQVLQVDSSQIAKGEWGKHKIKPDVPWPSKSHLTSDDLCY